MSADLAQLPIFLLQFNTPLAQKLLGDIGNNEAWLLVQHKMVFFSFLFLKGYCIPGDVWTSQESRKRTGTGVRKGKSELGLQSGWSLMRQGKGDYCCCVSAWTCWAGPWLSLAKETPWEGEAIRVDKGLRATKSLFLLGGKRGIKRSFISSFILFTRVRQWDELKRECS